MSEVKPSDIVKHAMMTVLNVTGIVVRFTGKCLLQAGDYAIKLGTSK
jgi:hypothetical protein